MARARPLTFAIGPLSIALFFGCTDNGDRLDASTALAGGGGKGGSAAGVGGAVAGRGHGGDGDDAGMGGDGASSASGGSDNGAGGPSKGGSQGVGGAGGKGARGGSGGGDDAGESGNGASGGVPAHGGAGTGGVSTGAGAGGTGASSGGIGPGGDGGAGGETALPDQLDLCVRLTDTTELAFDMTLLYESTVNHDCRVNWVARLYYDSTIGLNDRPDFLNQLLHFNLRLWGCPGSAAPKRFDLIFEPTPLSEADAATLIDAYVGSASDLLTLSPGEETAMRGLLERLSTKVLAEPDPGGYSEDRCAGGAGGTGAGGAGAGAGGGGGEGGAEAGGAAGQAGAG